MPRRPVARHGDQAPLGLGNIRGNKLIRFNRLRARLAQSLAFEIRPDLRFIGSAMERALTDRLAGEDSELKTAVVIGESLPLARLLGLRKTRLLVLPYPDFTPENLALLGDAYDFVIADRVLHRCGNLDDAARETVRVLKPGGWFVHTTSLLDFALDAGIDARRLSPSGLGRLFPHAIRASAERSASGSFWVVGQKAADAPALTPTVATRRARRPWYRFRPHAAKFGIVAMMRNEAPYLLEWIAYHRLLGFGQIAIYDNQSNDASARILAPLAKAGIVNAKFWSDRPAKQFKAYKNAIRRLRPFVDWCLFIDLDEFLVLDPGVALEDILPTEPDVMGVAIPWRMYGTGGMRNREAGLTIERFLKAAPENNRHPKSLVRLRDVREMALHMPKLINGRLTDIQGNIVQDRAKGMLPGIVEGSARINHYHCRSWEEYQCKRARGRGAVTGKFHPDRSFEELPAGEVELRDVLRMVPALKDEIARLRKIVG